MQPPKPLTRASRLGAVGIVGPIGLALLASVPVWTHWGEPRKSRVTPCLSAHVALAITPTTAVDFTACPGVTSPAASVARFSIWPLPMVASVVEVCRLREVAVAQIGGLYGP